MPRLAYFLPPCGAISLQSAAGLSVIVTETSNLAGSAQNRSISRAGPEECDGRSVCVSHKTGQYQGQIQRGAMGGVCVSHKQVNIKGRSRGVPWEECVCRTNRSISRAGPQECHGRSVCVTQTGQYQGQVQRGAMGGVCVCHTKQVNIKGRSRGVRWEECVCRTNRSISRAGPEECDGRSVCVAQTGQYQGQVHRSAMGGVCVSHKQVNIKGRSRGVRWEECVCVTQNRSISRADPEGCDGRSVCVAQTGQYQGQVQRSAMGGVCVSHKQVNIKGRSTGVPWEECVCHTNRSISRAGPEGCDGRSLCVSHKTGQYQGQIQRGAMGGVCVCHTVINAS